MKKTLSIMLAFMLFIYSGVSVSFANPASNTVDENQLDQQIASQIDDSIMSQSKVPLQKITIDPSDSNQVELIINKYQLQPQTSKDIREYTEKIERGEITSGEINLYLPAGIGSEISTYATRTYVGYNNKTYYEDVVSYSSSSPYREIKKTTKAKWIDYANSTIDATAKLLLDTVMTTISAGVWNVISIFTAGIPSNVPTNNETRHEAALVETKVKKNTYLVLDGQYYFGSAVEYSNSHFLNLLRIPGYDDVRGANSALKVIYTDNYTTGADKKAWLSYVNGGYTERIPNFGYGGVSFTSL